MVKIVLNVYFWEVIYVKYCSHCGAQIMDEAVVCVHCGCSVANSISNPPAVQAKDDTMETVVKVFLILGCVSMGWLIIPLAWCIPITVMIFKRLNNNQPIGTGLKVCTLLFVNLVAGICLFCMNDQ